MKKAFDQNVSRARPRLRLGAALTEAADAAVAVGAEEVAPVAPPAPPVVSEASLGAALKAKAEKTRAPRPSALEAVQRAIADKPARTTQASLEMNAAAAQRPSARAEQIVAQATAAVLGDAASHQDEAIAHAESFVTGARSHREESFATSTLPAPRAQPVVTHARAAEPESSRAAAPVETHAPRAAAPFEFAEREVAHVEPPRHAVEVQTPRPEAPVREWAEPDADTRRERLKERLRAVRENPRPEPLPPTVAEAGVLAVERISTLQSELNRLRAVNLAITQDLEGARRQSEKATEEARLRMDESRRLTVEMEGRVKLLQELERELASLEGERDDALLALQESRQSLDAEAKERDVLKVEIGKRDQALAESLAEEERLCSELESSREDATALRRSVDALSTERDTLARQVAELTRERAELLEARKALEAVHRALHQAARSV